MWVARGAKQGRKEAPFSGPENWRSDCRPSLLEARIWLNRWRLFWCLPVYGNGRVARRLPAWTHGLCTATFGACCVEAVHAWGIAEIVSVLFGLFWCSLGLPRPPLREAGPGVYTFMEALRLHSGPQFWRAKSALSQSKADELCKRRRRSEAFASNQRFCGGELAQVSVFQIWSPIQSGRGSHGLALPALFVQSRPGAVLQHFLRSVLCLLRCGPELIQTQLLPRGQSPARVYRWWASVFSKHQLSMWSGSREQGTTTIWQQVLCWARRWRSSATPGLT